MRVGARPGGVCVLGQRILDHAHGLRAQSRAGKLDRIAGNEILRRLQPHADTRRGAGADEVTGLKRLILREVFNDAWNVENHRCRRPRLAKVAVDGGLQRVVLRR